MTKPPLPEPKFEAFSITADGHEFPHGEKFEATFPCCGLVVGHAWRGAQTEEAIASSRKALTVWLDNRWQRHDCALVSPENPHGLRPRKEVFPCPAA